MKLNIETYYNIIIVYIFNILCAVQERQTLLIVLEIFSCAKGQPVNNRNAITSSSRI